MNEKQHDAIRNYEFLAHLTLEGVSTLLFFVCYFFDFRLRLGLKATPEDITVLFLYWLIFHICTETYRVYHTAAQGAGKAE